MLQRNGSASKEQKDIEILAQPLLSSSSSSSSSSERPLHRSQRKYIINKPPPFYTTLAAIIMLSVGTVFLGLGVMYLYNDGWQRWGEHVSVLLLGSLLFIPGSYSSLILYGSWVGWCGYSYDQVPSYDD